VHEPTFNVSAALQHAVDALQSAVSVVSTYPPNYILELDGRSRANLRRVEAGLLQV
jgi:hypothetical protein